MVRASDNLEGSGNKNHTFLCFEGGRMHVQVQRMHGNAENREGGKEEAKKGERLLSNRGCLTSKSMYIKDGEEQGETRETRA